MYILFLDESGTPPGSLDAARKQNQRYFVIGGLVIPAAEWRLVAHKLQGIKTRHHLRGELKWRYFAPGNDDADNPMRSLAHPQRCAIRIECLGIITAVKSIRVIASVASVPAAFALPTVGDAAALYTLTYKTVTERFQYYLQDLKKQTGSDEFGLVVCDQRGHDSDRDLRAQHQRLVSGPGFYTSKYPNFIETVFFAPSHMSVGIQLADMVAGAVWRKFERGDDECYELIKPAFRRSTRDVIDGYGVIRVPKTGWV